MIKINLLGIPKPAARATEPAEGLAPEAIILPGAFLVVLVLITVFVYWYYNSQIAKLKVEQQNQLAEQKRLANIMEQNKEFEARANELQHSKDTIDKLLASRVGPVELMRTLGRLVDRSNDVYLLTVKPNGDRIAVDGVADTADAIANFIAAMEQSGVFQDVQLKQSYQDNRANRISFKFTLDCAYKQGATAGAATTPAPRVGG